MLHVFHLTDFLQMIDARNVHSMELYEPNGKICPIWILPVTSATVGALEVEERHGNTSVQQESIQVCLKDSCF